MSMKIERGKVVVFNYTLSDGQGNRIETSIGRQPATYLHGRNNIVPGLENEMRGREAGDTFKATVAPEHAYGMRDERNLRRVPTKHLIRPGKLAPGKVVAVRTQRGQAQGIVLKVGRFNVDVDFNHPLAGRTLVFDVEILEVRDASPEELAHGHAHGPGGAEPIRSAPA